MGTIRRQKRLFNYSLQYNSLYLLYKYHHHFFRSLIFRGNKLCAFNYFINIKYNLKFKECLDPLIVFYIAISNITPEVLLFPYKSSGTVYDVAMPITIRKQIIFATKWVIKLLKKTYRIVSVMRITSLLLDSIKNDGLGILEKEEVYFKAINNRFMIRYFR